METESFATGLVVASLGLYAGSDTFSKTSRKVSSLCIQVGLLEMSLNASNITRPITTAISMPVAGVRFCACNWSTLSCRPTFAARIRSEIVLGGCAGEVAVRAERRNLAVQGPEVPTGTWKCTRSGSGVLTVLILLVETVRVRVGVFRAGERALARESTGVGRRSPHRRRCPD